MGANRDVGQFGEEAAADFIEGLGYVVLDRNWRCDEGEIDIVALDEGAIVVCEVKTRSGFGFGSGLDAVTREKLARLRRLAARWQQESGRPGPRRIDIIAVHRGPNGPQFEHVKGV
jgi:putative endonuclease